MQTTIADFKSRYRDSQKKIASLFNNEVRGADAAFSIQNVAETGLKDYGKYPGEWYGISAASQVFEKLDTNFRPIENFRICTF